MKIILKSGVTKQRKRFVKNNVLLAWYIPNHHKGERGGRIGHWTHWYVKNLNWTLKRTTTRCNDLDINALCMISTIYIKTYSI